MPVINVCFVSFGPGNSNPITLLSKYMLGSAASFGLFMCLYILIYV